MLRNNMKSKIKPGTNNINKRRGLKASVLMNARCPINAGSVLNAGVSWPICSNKRQGRLLEVLRCVIHLWFQEGHWAKTD